MIIGICGFGYTGSGAVKDYLNEYDDIKITKAEFGFLCAPDGLADLARNVLEPVNRTGSSIRAIDRYVQLTRRAEAYFCKLYSVDKKAYRASVEEFIDSITLTTWQNFPVPTNPLSRLIVTELLSKRVVPHLEFRLKRQVNFYPMKTVRLSGPCMDFYAAAKRHMDQLLAFMKLDGAGYAVLDQGFSANNPQVCFPFVDDPKAVIVDKDPRDLYVFSREMLAGYGHFMPMNDVRDFVRYYLGIRDGQPYRTPDENVLVLRFEDLIYSYDETTKRLRDFLRLPENPNPFRHFDPKVSIGNTQIYKRFPKYRKDIEYIETALDEYLFDFGKYENVAVDKKMFV